MFHGGWAPFLRYVPYFHDCKSQVKKRLGTFFCDVYWNATYNRVRLKKVDWALCSATYNQMQLTIVKVYGIRFAKIIGNFLFDFVDFYLISNYKKKSVHTKIAFCLTYCVLELPRLAKLAFGFPQAIAKLPGIALRAG